MMNFDIMEQDTSNLPGCNAVAEELRLHLRAAVLEEQELLLNKIESIISEWVISLDSSVARQSFAGPIPTSQEQIRSIASQSEWKLESDNPFVPEIGLRDIDCECPKSMPSQGTRLSSQSTELEHARGIGATFYEEITDRQIQAVRLGEKSVKNLRQSLDTFANLKVLLGSWSSLIDWWHGLREPRRSGLIANLVQGQMFEVVCLFVIMCNGVHTIVDTNQSMANLREGSSAFMNNLELIFIIFYSWELLLKILTHRLFFFCNEDCRWNILDFVLVVTGLLEVIAELVSPDKDFSNPSFIRMIRLLRIARILRMVRVLHFFAELRLMLTCVIGSFMSLFWAFFLILCFSILFAIVLVQRMAAFLQEQEHRLPEMLADDIKTYFGSVQLTALYLFQCISGGDWTYFYDVVKETGWLNAAIFLTYILFVWLSVTNIIMCIFVEKAMKLAQPNIEELLYEKHKQDLSMAEVMMELYKEMDSDGNGTLSWNEFRMVMEDERIASYFEISGLDINDAFMFFKMLSSIAGSDEIDLDTFIKGCLKLKGFAMNIDLIQLSYEVKILSKNQVNLFMQMREDINKRLDDHASQWKGSKFSCF